MHITGECHTSVSFASPSKRHIQSDCLASLSILLRHDTSTVDTNHCCFNYVRLAFPPACETVVLKTISSTYWMAGLAPEAVHFFKFLLILVLYSLAMTLFVR